MTAMDKGPGSFSEHLESVIQGLSILEEDEAEARCGTELASRVTAQGAKLSESADQAPSRQPDFSDHLAALACYYAEEDLDALGTDPGETSDSKEGAAIAEADLRVLLGMKRSW